MILLVENTKNQRGIITGIKKDNYETSDFDLVLVSLTVLKTGFVLI